MQDCFFSILIYFCYFARRKKKRTCIRTRTSSLGSAFAMAPTVRYPFSQKTRLEEIHISTFYFCLLFGLGMGNVVGTYAVRLLINGILASARRSVLAPAINRSEKCSRAAAMILQVPRLVTSRG